MRPYAMTQDRGLQPDMTCDLFVYRQWTNGINGAWRLCWHAPNSGSFVNAEGECSARYFRTMREAIAYGERRYSETARKWRGHGWDFPNDTDDHAETV